MRTVVVLLVFLPQTMRAKEKSHRVFKAQACLLRLGVFVARALWGICRARRCKATVLRIVLQVAFSKAHGRQRSGKLPAATQRQAVASGNVRTPKG